MSPVAQRNIILHPRQRTALLILLGAGLLLWIINLLYARPIFLDEANIVRNLHDRSFAELFRPLDYEQYAPPLYLVFTKLLAELFGYSEIVLRLPASVGGLLAVYGLYRAGEYLGLRYWTLLPLALLFVNPTVLRFTGEVKPYGIDLGIAACLIAMHLGERGQLWKWILIGVLAPWFSLPSVFVLGAIGLHSILRDRKWLLPIASWLASFTLLYLTVLRGEVGSDYLNDFHAAYFFPLPTNSDDLRIVSGIIWRLLRLAYGFTWVGLGWGTLVVLTGTLHLRSRHFWLIAPLLLAIVASGFQYYSLIERLMLFALPGLWLATALTAKWIYERLGKYWRLAFIAVTLVTLGGTNVYRYYLAPMRFSDGRALAALATQHPYEADRLAVPVLDYYLRIHPAKRRPADRVNDGERYRLYDGTTAAAVRETMTKDSLRATARGCNVERLNLYRAGALRIKCP